jgi:hypothetical protein
LERSKPKRSGLMPDTNFKDAEVTLRTSEDYRESDDFVPNPTDQTGTVDTSGTGGMANSRIEEVTPIFELANKQDRITAARALDPDDDEVTRSHVVMPTGQVFEALDKDEIIDQARRAATKVVDEDVVMGGPTASQKAAAEDTSGDRDSERSSSTDDGGAEGSTSGASTTEPSTSSNPNDPDTVKAPSGPRRSSRTAR